MADYRFVMNDRDRCGTVVYHEGDRNIEIYWEPMASYGSGATDGVGLCLNLKEWTDPKGVRIDREHQLEILYRLRQWLKDQKIRSSVDLPSNIKTTDRQCLWRDCAERRIKGSVFCMLHHDWDVLGLLSE